MQPASSLLANLRRLASLLMLLAVASLAPAAVAGSYEAGLDAAQIAISVSSLDADGCVSKADAKGQKAPLPDGEHCPACCLHHHGPNGLNAESELLSGLLPSGQSWAKWHPSDLLQAPARVLIQPPRA